LLTVSAFSIGISLPTSVKASSIEPQLAGTDASAAVTAPLGIQSYVPITITNSQSSPTPTPFQQMITVNSNTYSSLEASDLQNVEFFDSSGNVVPSWLESGNSNTSTATIYWLRLANGIPADSSVTVYMGFASTVTNLFNSVTTGEAPQLSPGYGQYDDGANVFPYYWNFAGTSLPSGWEFSIGNAGPPDNGGYTVNNGASFYTGFCGSQIPSCYSAVYGYYNVPLAASSYIISTEMQSYSGGNNGEGVYFGWWSSPQASTSGNHNGNYVIDFIGCPDFDCVQHFEVASNACPEESSGCPESVASYDAKQYMAYSLSWFGSTETGTLYPPSGESVTLNETQSSPPQGSYYLGFWCTTAGAGNNGETTQWVAASAMPPNGVMPRESFGSLAPSSSCNPSANWQSCESLNVVRINVNFALLLTPPIEEYNLCCSAGHPISLSSWEGVPPASVLLITSSASTGFSLTLQQFFQVSPEPDGTCATASDTYSPVALIIFELPFLQTVQALNLVSQSTTGPLTFNIPSGDSWFFTSTNFQTTPSGYLNLAFLVSLNTNTGETLPALQTALSSDLSLAYKSDLAGIITALVSNLNALLTVGDVKIYAITSDLTADGQLSSVQLADVCKLAGAVSTIGKISSTVGNVLTLLDSGGKIYSTAGADLLADAQFVVTLADLGIDLGIQGTPYCNTSLCITLTSDFDSLTTFLDPGGTTLLPSYYNSSGSLVLGYNVSSGSMLYASPFGILFPVGEGYLAMLNENQANPANYIESLSSVGGNNSVPYEVLVSSYNESTSTVGYVGMVTNGGAVSIPLDISSSGSLIPADHLIAQVSVRQSVINLDVTAKGEMSDGTAAQIAHALLLVQGLQFNMTQIGPSTYGLNLSMSFDTPAPLFVYLSSNNTVGGVGEALARATTITDVSCGSFTILLGATTTCTVRVSGNSPTETVNWSQTGLGLTLSSSSCSLSTSQCQINVTGTAVGSVTIKASYVGDSNNLASNSTMLVSVNQASETTVSCSSPVAVGTPSTCTATVSGYNPSGTVTFTASGSGTFLPSGVCTLSSGGSCSVGYVPGTTTGSPQTITASYSGDINNLPSSGVSEVMVNPSITGTAVTCNLSTVLLGTSTECIATVTDHSPTGTVSWSQAGGAGSVTISPTSCTLTSSYQCEVTVTGTEVGPVTLKASYGGDTNDVSSSSTFALTVSYGETSSCSLASVVVGTPTSCRATVTGSPTPTGKVTWSSSPLGKFSSPSCKLKNGACSVVYTPSSSGSTTITAKYTGHPSYSATFGLTVNKAPTTTRISCSPTSVVVGSSKTIKCTATVTGYKPTGTVTWTQSSVNGGSVSLISATCTLAKGHCSVTMTATSAGTVTITGTYGGDTNNFGSPGASGVTIKQAKTSLSLSCSSASKDKWTCTATLKGFFGSVSGEAITWSQTGGKGKVTFSPSNTCTLSSGPSSTMTCSVTVTGTSKGSVTIEAVYPGDTNNVGSSRTVALKVT
jgi:hypothetical protein